MPSSLLNSPAWIEQLEQRRLFAALLGVQGQIDVPVYFVDGGHADYLKVPARTIVDLNPKPPEAQQEAPKREGCDVHEFGGATDVPAGAKSLGPVRVPREGTDEAIKEALIQAVCKMGGDAFSSLQWVKEPGVWEPVAREATAWDLPSGTP